MVFDAVILAGGSSARLDGEDKAGIVLDGTTFLDRALQAAAAARRIVVAGPRRNLAAGVAWVQEDPPGGGPLAALAAALPLLEAELIVVLAVDHPLVTATEVALLVASARPDGAVALDRDGRVQPLLAAYPKGAFEAAVRTRALPGGRAHHLLSQLQPALVELGDAATDCDTWQAIEEVRTLVRTRA